MGVVEAEAMGVPVIVTSIPGPVDAMKENETGLVVVKKDVVGLTKAMKIMQDNPQMCKQFGVAGEDWYGLNSSRRSCLKRFWKIEKDC